MIDELARAAGHDLRTATTSDLEAGMREVYAGHAQRGQERVRAATLALALTLAVGWFAGYLMARGGSTSPQPVGPPQVAPTQVCSGLVHCLGSSAYRFDLAQPLTWHVPAGYEVSSATSATRWQVETDAQLQGNGGGPYQFDTVAGVTVLEGVQAPSADGESPRADVADSPRALVTWLAAQPYVVASEVGRTRVNDRPAWHVRVRLPHGVGAGPATCRDGHACYPTALTPDHQVIGIRDDMVADYTAFRVPGAGPTVIWSWAFSHDRDALARNRIAVDGLSWPVASD